MTIPPRSYPRPCENHVQCPHCDAVITKRLFTYKEHAPVPCPRCEELIEVAHIDVIYHVVQPQKH